MPESESDLPAVVVTSHDIALEDVYRVALEFASVELREDAVERVDAARAVVEHTLSQGHHTYGLNSGLGHGKDERLSAHDLDAYGIQTLDAHAAGVGPALGDADVRAMMFARVAGMTRGGAGVHPGVVHTLIAMLNTGVTPHVPEVGSVGASDLMHLAAIGQVVIGRGRARYGGEVLPGREALLRAGVQAHMPAPQDALSLISGNATSIGLGALAVLEAERTAELADVAGVLTLEVVDGSITPFDAEVAAAKPFPGQVAAAAHLRALLDGSDLETRDGPSIQDPLSLRVMPQVHGALRDQIRAARDSVHTELNARDDNPLVSVVRRRMIPNGNFHPLVLALAFESLRVGLAHAGMISERRMNKVASFSFGTGALFPNDGAWTPGRYAEEGVLAYSAAALVARLKQLAMPVTLGVPPLDQDIEDHATLAPTAVTLAREAVQILETILAIEVLLAADRLTSLPARQLGARIDPVYEGVRSVLEGSGAHPMIGDLVEEVRLVLRATTTTR
jgi:histidine ammonia-lyase